MGRDQEQELRDALARLPRGEWQVQTSNSYRRIGTYRGADGNVLHGVVQRDGHPDLSMDAATLTALCDLRNTVAKMLGEV